MSDTIWTTAFGQVELAHFRWVEVGDRIECPSCGKRHTLKRTNADSVVLWYKCGQTTCLGAVANRCLIQ